MIDIWHTELNDFEKEQGFCCLFFTKSEPKTLCLGYHNPCTQMFGNYMSHERYSYYEIDKFANVENLVRVEAELEKTRKALEIAVEALKDFSIHPDDGVKKYAKKALEQITTEQKDVK